VYGGTLPQPPLLTSWIEAARATARMPCDVRSAEGFTGQAIATGWTVPDGLPTYLFTFGTPMISSASLDCSIMVY